MREETRYCHMGYSFLLTARVLLYAPSHRQDSTYHSLCYTSCGTLGGTRNSSMGSPHEGSIRWPITPWANALTMELHLAPILIMREKICCSHFICTIPQTREHIPQPFYTSHGALAIKRDSSMGPPWEINLSTHCPTSRCYWQGLEVNLLTQI